MRLKKDIKPYVTYHYYLSIHHGICSACDHSEHHLLRYRTYMLARLPIFPTRNYYYLVCGHCSKSAEVEDEFLLIQLLHKARHQKPIVFNSDIKYQDHVNHESLVNLHINAIQSNNSRQK